MNNPILEVRNLHKLYRIPRGVAGLLRGQPPMCVHAVDGINFNINRGEILALVGESGSGKTTTGLCTLGLKHPTEGKILLDGEDVADLATGRRRKELRRRAQLIFQDPYEALNPRQTVFKAVAEPIVVHHLAKGKAERNALVKAKIEIAGLKPAEDYFQRFPQELSGGQRQRVVIASGLALEPQLLVADEPVSMLDVSIRAEILNLLLELRDQQNITILYITHDLATAAYVADRVAVMYLGVIVEIGPAEVVLNKPYHPYTQALLSVIPSPRSTDRPKRIVLEGDPPDPIDLPGGCRFHPRCPQAEEECRFRIPTLSDQGNLHLVMCGLKTGVWET